MPPRTTTWNLEPHTLGKHKVLRNYLDGWLPILGSWSGRILFIDGFAGPGQYEGGEDGSPIIALKALIQHRAKKQITAEVVYFFIEEDKERADFLRQLVADIRPQLPPSAQVEVETGKFDEAMTKVLDQIDSQTQLLAPSFVMVDPFGVSGTPMSVIERILRNPRSEVYISFMYEPINRFKATEEFEHHLDELFGTTTWRNGIPIEDPLARQQFFYELYDRQLRNAGATYVVHFDLYEGNRLVYSIFFGTKNLKGCDLMKQAIWKIAPFGDFAFRAAGGGQLSLSLEQEDFRALQDILRNEYRGKGWVDIETINDFVASDRTDYHTGQYKRGALIPLENAGKIEIDPASRNRMRTYPAGTRLRFK